MSLNQSGPNYNLGLSNLSQLLSKLSATIDNITIAQGSDTINVKVFNERDKTIEQLEQSTATLAVVVEKLAAKLARAQAERSKDIDAIQMLIKSTTLPISLSGPNLSFSSSLATNTSPDTWNHVQRRKPAANRTLKQYTDAAKSVEPVSNNSLTNIKITAALSLPAISVHTFEQVIADGNLYYVSNANHFAIKIAGRLLHGNIGTIYTDEKNPEKIKDCRYQHNCTKNGKCDFYHDPVKFIGSTDCRNYTASSFLYAGAGTKTRGRRFGSRDNLDIDIVAMNEEDISRFSSQTMHDILCSLLLHSGSRA